MAEDPALKRFKSHKKSVNTVKRMGDVLTLVVVAGKTVYLLMVYAIALKILSTFEECMVDMKSNTQWTYWNKSNLFKYLQIFHVLRIFLNHEMNYKGV